MRRSLSISLWCSAQSNPHLEEPRACAASRRMARALSAAILRDAKKLVIGPAKPDPLDAAPQDEVGVCFRINSTAPAKPSSSLEAVTCDACFLTPSVALPIAMESPL